jgi:hypothetical protein
MPMEPPPEQIAIRFNTSADVTYCVCCAIGFPGLLWAAIWGFADLQLKDLGGMRLQALAELAFTLIGPFGFRFIAGIFALIACAVGLGAAWRLADRRPALIASASGLVFHPSLCRRPLSWPEIDRISLTLGGATRFRFALRRWNVSLYAPVPGKRIDLALVACGLSYGKAEDNLLLMRRWQREAGC